VSNPKHGIVAVGHGLVDMFGRGTQALNESFRKSTYPHHVSSSEMEKLLATLQGDPTLLIESISMRPGGGAVNAAIASRRMGLGARVFACFGYDSRGDAIIEALREYGIECFGIRSKRPTGVFLSLSMGEDCKTSKKIIVSPGAAREIRGCYEYDNIFIKDWYMLIDGLLIDAHEWLQLLAEKALDAGMKIALDVSTVATVRRYAGKLLEFASDYCDYVFLNEEEHSALLEATGLPKQGSLSLHGKAKALIKLGKRGAMAIGGDKGIEVPTLPIETDNDVGAGDAFAAGFLLAAMQGLDVEKSLITANESAGDYLRQQVNVSAKDKGVSLDIVYSIR
jgi:sugar/nucleoside kinase (ribokinase family)